MITFSPMSLQRHRASWHEDQELTKRQAKLLFDDVEATRDRYIAEAVALMVQPSDIGQIEFRRDDDGLIWVVWASTGDSEGQALAVFTEPQTRIEGYHMIVEWHWSPISQGVN
jgi:hypothetical protein